MLSWSVSLKTTNRLYYWAQNSVLTCFHGNTRSCLYWGCWCRPETGCTCCPGDPVEASCFGAPAHRSLRSGQMDTSGKPAWSRHGTCTHTNHVVHVKWACLHVCFVIVVVGEIYFYSPAVEAAVDDGVVHGGAHRQPQHRQVNLLDVLPLAQRLVKTRHNEVDMIREPAEGKGHHHDNHHLHHLREQLTLSTAFGFVFLVLLSLLCHITSDPSSIYKVASVNMLANSC